MDYGSRTGASRYEAKLLCHVQTWKEGVSQINEDAFKCFATTSDQGNAQAKFILANIYANDQGVPQSHQE
jgi:TPR repeat protein